MTEYIDDYSLAEKGIRRIIINKDDQDKVLDICKWLFSINEEEINHKIKYYESNVPDVRFCVDRGWFLTIRHNYRIHVRVLKPEKYVYFKHDQLDIYTIPPSDAHKLSLDVIKNHILESYCIRLKKLGVKSSICDGIDDKPPVIKVIGQSIQQIGELPQIPDIELAYLQLRRSSNDVINIQDILNKIEVLFNNSGRILDANWRDITNQNIQEWYRHKE